MIAKLLTQHHLEFLSLKGGCRGSSESTLVKMSNGSYISDKRVDEHGTMSLFDGIFNCYFTTNHNERNVVSKDH